MMVLGEGVKEPDVVERTVRHIDLTPTLGSLLSVDCDQAQGSRLPELTS
jgi:hypothetical protein